MSETHRRFRTVDTHTAGEPTRVLVDGFDPVALDGADVAARRAAFRREFDWLREFLLKEPRGHADMFGAVPLGPGPDTHLDVFFMDTEGYLDMCGHALIGVVTALCERGRLDPASPLRVGTPAGVVEATPTVVDGRVESVTFVNVGSYVCDRLTVDVAGHANVPVSVVAAGNHFAIADLPALDRSFADASVPELVDLGLELRAAVNERGVVDPLSGEDVQVRLAELTEPRPDADRSIVVFADGSVDRSPCGTGTAAKLALLYDRGDLDVDEPYVHESPIGTRFEGRIRWAAADDAVPVVGPEITGSAHVTGEHAFYRDPADDLGAFTLGT